MSSLRVHCHDCEERLGKEYKHVHRYLDQYAKDYNGSKLHRHKLHNREGIRQVEERWGSEAAEAARIHIERDNSDVVGDFLNKFSMRRR